MSIHHRRTIAKEIVEQAIRHIKKQRENATRKQPEQKSEERCKPSARKQSEERYEPSAEFHNVFTEMIGEKEKSDLPQETQKNAEPKQKEENLNKSAQPSVFEILSRRASEDK